MRATVLLDLYGTLVEPNWAELREGRSAIAERVGLTATAAHDAWNRTHAARMAGTYGSLTDDLAAIVSEASDHGRSTVSAPLLAQLAAEERENWRSGVRVYPDVRPALSLLRSLGGLRLAIVTNASAEAAGVVDALALRPLVDDVFASCESGVLKPELLEVALREMGVDASDATLVDDEPAQLADAARLGIATVLVQRPGASAAAAAEPGPHPVITDLRELADLAVLAGPARRR